MAIDQHLTNLAELALDHARKKGAQEVAVAISRAKMVSLRRRARQTEHLEASTTCGLSLSVLVDNRFSSNSTSFLQPEPIKNFIDEVIAMTRHLAPDANRRLPDPQLYGPTTGVDLDLFDRNYDAVDMDRRSDWVSEAEDAGLTHSPQVISATAETSSQTYELLQIHSNGFRGTKEGTAFSLSTEVTSRGDGDERPEDYSAAGAIHWQSIPSPTSIGEEAARRAIGRIGAKKTQSGRYTMIIENRSAGRLLSSLLQPLSGAALQQKRSCLDGKKGQKLGSSLLTIHDDPLIPRGLGSRTFDEEGLAAKKLSLLTEGTLDNYFIDVYYGRKLNMPTTSGGTSNLILKLGTRPLAEILKGTDKAILVTGFLGGNSNPATGDFSFGVSGFLIENGERTQPLSEMNITGNHLEIWHQLVEVGNDPYPYSAWRIPALVFDKIQFSGT